MSFFYSKVSFTNLPCQRVSGYIKHAKSSPNCSIVAGGGFDESVGYFIEPTVFADVGDDMSIAREEVGWQQNNRGARLPTQIGIPI